MTALLDKAPLGVAVGAGVGAGLGAGATTPGRPYLNMGTAVVAGAWSSRTIRPPAASAAALPPETSFLGFAGSPWTVATYMVAGQGSKDQAAARRMGKGSGVTRQVPAEFREALELWRSGLVLSWRRAPNKTRSATINASA